MESFDAKCKFLELTTSTTSVSIPGRLRLNCFFYVRKSPTSSSINTSSYRYLKFYDGSSSSGPLIYSHLDSLTYDPPLYPCYVMPEDGLLFENGLFVDSENDGSNRYFGCISIIYSGI
jgi:hypothetical protein